MIPGASRRIATAQTFALVFALALGVSIVGLAARTRVGAQRAGARAAAAAGAPNIVFILADDLGYGELGVYGQTRIRTPRLDRLAAQGMRFTQFYAGSPVCAPSRGTFLTGRHTGHALVRDNKEFGGFADDEERGQLPLPAGEPTVAEWLRAQGYATAAIGKWGLGGPGSVGLPTRHGFESHSLRHALPAWLRDWSSESLGLSAQSAICSTAISIRSRRTTTIRRISGETRRARRSTTSTSRRISSCRAIRTIRHPTRGMPARTTRSTA